MHTYTDLCLAHPLETWTPFDIVVNSAYALLPIPVTHKPTNVVISPFIRYSGTSAYSRFKLRCRLINSCCWHLNSAFQHRFNAQKQIFIINTPSRLTQAFLLDLFHCLRKYGDIFHLMTDNDNAGTFGFMFSLHFELRFHAFCEPNPEYARLAYLKTTKTSFFYTQLFGLAYFAGVFSFNGNFFKIRQRPKYARKRRIR